MITSASSAPLDARALTLMVADIALLPDDELVDLAVVWRLRARRGERKAFGLAQALEVEQRRRQSTPSVLVSPSLRTLVATRPWWEVRGGRDAGQLVTSR